LQQWSLRYPAWPLAAVAAAAAAGAAGVAVVVAAAVVGVEALVLAPAGLPRSVQVRPKDRVAQLGAAQADPDRLRALVQLDPPSGRARVLAAVPHKQAAVARP